MFKFGSFAALGVLSSAAMAQIAANQVPVADGWQIFDEPGTRSIMPTPGSMFARDVSIRFIDTSPQGGESAAQAFLKERGFSDIDVADLINQNGSRFERILGTKPNGERVLILSTRPESGMQTAIFEAANPRAFAAHMPQFSQMTQRWIGSTKPSSKSGSWQSPDGRTRASASASGSGDRSTSNVSGGANEHGAWASSSNSSSSSSSDRKTSSNRGKPGGSSDRNSSSQSNSSRDGSSMSNQSQMDRSNSAQNGSPRGGIKLPRKSSPPQEKIVFDPSGGGFQLIAPPQNPREISGRFVAEKLMIKPTFMSKEADALVCEISPTRGVVLQELVGGRMAVQHTAVRNPIDGSLFLMDVAKGTIVPVDAFIVDTPSGPTLSLGGILLRRR